MPYTLSDEEISLLLHHLLSHPADPALVPIIHSLHFSLVASRTTSLHNTANSGELFRDFLGSPEDFNDWDTPSLPNPSLPNPSLSNPSHSDLLDDHYSVDVANFERLSDVISDYISCCDYGDPAAISSTNDYGISPSLVFGAKIHETASFNVLDREQEDENRREGRGAFGAGGNGGEDGRRDSERPVAETSEHILEGEPGEVGGRTMEKRTKRRKRCKRGGKSSWDASGAVEDSQGLPKPCAMVLASLSSQSNLLTPGPETPTISDSQCHHDIIVDMKNMLSGECWKESQVAFQVNSLENIILRCQRAEKVEVGIQFISMVNFIQLAAKVESIRRSKKLSSGTQVLREEWSKGGHQTVHTRTLQKWLAHGTKFAVLAGAGSLYLLMLIAFSKLKSSICNLTGDMVPQLASVIRHPTNDTAFGRQVINSIIPALTHLRDTFHLKFSTMFSYQLLQDYDLSADFNAADLEKSDIFFNSLPVNGFCQERNWDAWGLWKNNVSSTIGPPQLSVSTFNHSILSIGSSSSEHNLIRQLSPCSEDDDVDGKEKHMIHLDSNLWESPISQTTSANQITIKTKYNSSLPDNCRLICPGKEQREKRFHFTLGERKRAEQAKVPPTVEETENMIRTQLQNGKKPIGSYVRVRTSLFPDKVLRIDEHDDSLLVFIIPTMPSSIRKHLLDGLHTLFPGKLVDKDSKAEGIDNFFEALHLSWYNRYSTKGDGAPKDANPSMLTKSGLKRANPTQFIPRTSKELQQHLDDYESLQQIFEPLFSWLSNVMSDLLPEHFIILKQWVELLPSNDFSPVFPFGGLVINMNVATRVHRDTEDLSLCFILEISDCEGGELCLMEPGLVIELRNGDGVAFCSNKITHFNLDFKGKRASFVFHSDRAGLAWCKDGNGWKGNKFFSLAE